MNCLENADGSYEPIALPPGIEENVNKKVAKYQRLRAKKTENVTRHKSPETRSEFPSGPVVKEPSVSPLPSTSSTRNKIIGDEARSDDEERSATGGRLSSDYEEVEISQEVENIEKVDEEDEEDADGVIVEYEEEEEEEDVIESSNVDESGEEAELMVEAEEEDQGNNNETGEVYGAVEISSGVSITPSDTDKVIIVGGSGMSAAAMAIRNNSTNVNNINSIIIMTEERNSDKTSTDIADENMIYEVCISSKLFETSSYIHLGWNDLVIKHLINIILCFLCNVVDSSSETNSRRESRDDSSSGTCSSTSRDELL